MRVLDDEVDAVLGLPADGISQLLVQADSKAHVSRRDGHRFHRWKGDAAVDVRPNLLREILDTFSVLAPQMLKSSFRRPLSMMARSASEMSLACVKVRTCRPSPKISKGVLLNNRLVDEVGNNVGHSEFHASVRLEVR